MVGGFVCNVIINMIISITQLPVKQKMPSSWPLLSRFNQVIQQETVARGYRF
jgi:hypothetical protein